MIECPFNPAAIFILGGLLIAWLMLRAIAPFPSDRLPKFTSQKMNGKNS